MLKDVFRGLWGVQCWMLIQVLGEVLGVERRV